MLQTLKNKWIKALTSGKYRQVRRHLGNTGKGRCCLGVLCDIMRYKFIPFSKCDEDGAQNLIVYRKISELIGSSEKCVLMRQNDGGDSFQKIANWIKENL